MDSGKPERIPVYGKTIKELEEKIAEIRYKSKTGEYIKNTDMLFCDYANHWYDTYKAKRRTRTKSMYEYVLNKYIVPEIGNLKLRDILKSDIQYIINTNFELRRTCEQIRLTLNQIFKQALEDDLIRKIPTNNLIMPPKEQSDKRALTKTEKKSIISAEFSDREKAYIYVIFYMGLRKCEALALTNLDFNFKERTVSINKDLLFVKNKPIIEGTKNKYSVRKVLIPTDALPFLKKYVDNLKTVNLFTGINGELITESSYRRMWESIINKLNYAACTPKERELNLQKIQGLTSYTFRHNYATMLYYSGISLKMASSYMGHRDTKMILEVYSHLDEEKENVVSKINSIKLG